VLVYQVTLTNGTLQPMDLIANCPNYGEELVLINPNGGPTRGIKPAFQLNCSPAGTIQPKASQTFEMRLTIPQNEAPGLYKLFFTLGYWNAMTTPTSAPVTISE
jgi:hypothetical protein